MGVQAQAGDMALIARRHLDAPAAVMRQDGAHGGHLLGQQEGQAAQRVDVFFHLGQTRVDFLAHILQQGAGIGIPQAAFQRHQQGDGASSCSSSTSPTISSTRSSKVTMPSVPEYSSSTTARCTRPRRISASTSSAGRGQGTNSGWRSRVSQSVGVLPLARRKHILDEDHADHLIQRLAIDGHARMAMGGKGGDHLIPACGVGNGDDLATRNADVGGVHFTEMEQIAQHLALGLLKVALRGALRGVGVLMLVDDLFEMSAQRLIDFAAVEKALHSTPQRTFTVRVSIAAVAGPAQIGPHFMHSFVN
jgi:hypothetical protein